MKITEGKGKSNDLGIAEKQKLAMIIEKLFQESAKDFDLYHKGTVLQENRNEVIKKSVAILVDKIVQKAMAIEEQKNMNEVQLKQRELALRECLSELLELHRG
ncbi:MAG: hypothetical protein WCT14_16885 [Treponemataceae bacterium]